MSEEIHKIGGNTIKEKIGKRIEKIGKSFMRWGLSIIDKAKPLVISNPVCKVVNPFTIIISFTITPSEKYQIIIEGDYKKYYKDFPEGIVDIPEYDVFYIIRGNQNKWFRKE